MATTTTTSTASGPSKANILSHMTKDHGRSLGLYLQHYNKVPSSSTANASLDDLNLNNMVISAGADPSRKQRYTVAIDPPMKSFSESRERMVTMHKESLAGLDLSDTQITEFRMPNLPWEWAVHLFCIWCFLTFPNRAAILEPGTVSNFGWSIAGYATWWAKIAYYIQPVIQPWMYLCHGTEVAILIRGRLRKHNVPTFSLAWFGWVVTTATGGVAAYTRFDDLVKEKEEKAARKGLKH